MSLSQTVAIAKRQALNTMSLQGNKKVVNNLDIALARYKHNNTYKANVLFIGDSAVEGAGSTDAQTYGYPSLLNTFLQMKQFNGASAEYVFYPYPYFADNNVPFSDTGTWTHVTNSHCPPTYGMTNPDTLSEKYRGWTKTTVNGSTITIGSAGYNLRLLFASDGVFTGETAGTISYTINGGATVNVDLAGSTKYKWVDIDTSMSSASVVITANITEAGKSVAINAIHFIKSLVGVKLLNIGIGSSAAYHWADRISIVDAYAPIVSYVALGGNDIFHSKTAAEYETAMRTILTKLKSHGDVIYGYYFPVDVAHASMSGYSTAEKAGLLEKTEQFRLVAQRLALEFDCIFVDYHDILIDGATMAANGLLDDSIHPNNTGYEVKYQFLTNKIKV